MCIRDRVKNLPVGAGVGGGSADAAAALILLSELWGLPEYNMEQAALNLGADVPACLSSRPKYMSGVGEVIEKTELPKLHLVLVNPLKKLETKKVFDIGFNNYSGKLNRFGNENIIEYLQSLQNDLLDNAISFVPEVVNILNEMKEFKNCASGMSGSGATCFIASEDESIAYEIEEILVKNLPKYWVKKATVIA